MMVLKNFSSLPSAKEMRKNMQERILEAFVDEVHENGLKFTMDDLAKKTRY